MHTVRAVVAELPELMETNPLLRVAVSPNGETNVLKARVPLKPLRLAKVMAHTPPLTLVLVQPIWNPRVIPGVVPVIL